MIRSNNTVYDEQIGNLEDIACNLNIVLMFLGIIANFVSIWAFLHKKLLIRKFNWYLLVLSLFELIFCSVLFVDYTFSKLYDSGELLHLYSNSMNKLITFITHTSDSFIVLLTLFLSVDRLYAIKKPMQIRFFITNLHAKKLIGISILILFVLNLFSSLLLSSSYSSLFSPIMFHTVPLVIILLLNTFLVKEIIKYYRKQSRAHSKRKARDRRLIRIITDNRCNNDLKKCFSQHNISKISFKKIKNTQKSHFFILIVSDIWYLVTSIPYFTLIIYFKLLELHLVANIFDVKIVIILQIVSSIFFN